MSNEIKVFSLTGATLYTFLLDTSSRIYNTHTGAFETAVSGSAANYAIATPEILSGIYLGNFPAYLPAGVYELITYKQSGGSPSGSDAILTETSVDWTGSSVIPDAPVGSPEDSPPAPINVAVADSGGFASLGWTQPNPGSVMLWQVLRTDGQSFATTAASLVDTTVLPYHTYVYTVSAIGFNGLKSVPSSSVTLSL